MMNWLKNIEYKLELVVSMIYVIFALNTEDKVMSMLCVIIVLILIYARDIKLHIDKTVKKDNT